MYIYCKWIAGVGNGNYIYYLQSKGLSEERINSIKTPNHSITPFLDYYGTKARVESNNIRTQTRVEFKQDSVTFNHKKS